VSILPFPVRIPRQLPPAATGVSSSSAERYPFTHLKHALIETRRAIILPALAEYVTYDITVQQKIVHVDIPESPTQPKGLWQTPPMRNDPGSKCI
jgi:hypothetical protein